MPDDSASVFFYGSFIDLDLLAGYGVVPDNIEVARLSGDDISIAPRAAHRGAPRKLHPPVPRVTARPAQEGTR